MRRTPGKHEPNAKNRSSKHLGWFTKIKPIVRTMSNEWLTKRSNNGYHDATAELERRAKNRDKNDARKQKYLEKIAKKRNGVKQ